MLGRRSFDRWNAGRSEAGAAARWDTDLTASSTTTPNREGERCRFQCRVASLENCHSDGNTFQTGHREPRRSMTPINAVPPGV
jgi:hypothetical protein